MNNQFMQEVEHEPKKPVSIARDGKDGVIIEGIRFSGDYFRTLKYPKPDVLYAIHSEPDSTITFTVVRNENEAAQFFDGVFLADAIKEFGEDDTLAIGMEVRDGI